MKAQQILFSGPMVRALLAWTKTQTRRVVKVSDRLPHSNGILGWVEETAAGVSCAEPGWFTARLDAPGVQYTFRIKCPYGQPGDRLWVRETWGFRGRSLAYNVDGVPGRRPFDEVFIHYQADDTKKIFKRPVDNESNLPKPKPGMGNNELEKWWEQWRPSIHMPRWASRLTLEIVSVRVERLQDISEADAIAEGILEGKKIGACRDFKDYRKSIIAHIGFHDPRESYRTLWESINGPGSWSANPWVWVVEFRRTSTPETQA